MLPPTRLSPWGEPFLHPDIPIIPRWQNPDLHPADVAEHKPQEAAHCRTYSTTSNSPFVFSNKATTVTFTTDAQGTITQVRMHGKLFGDALPEEGKIFYPSDEVPALIQLVP